MGTVTNRTFKIFIEYFLLILPILCSPSHQSNCSSGRHDPDVFGAPGDVRDNGDILVMLANTSISFIRVRKQVKSDVRHFEWYGTLVRTPSTLRHGGTFPRQRQSWYLHGPAGDGRPGSRERHGTR